jgi:FtsH-binding integral membrane protein
MQILSSQVYSVLFLQLLGTTVIAALFSTPTVSTWMQANTWSYLVCLVGSLVTMGFLYFKRHSHPLNLVLLSLVSEAGHDICCGVADACLLHTLVYRS